MFLYVEREVDPLNLFFCGLIFIPILAFSLGYEAINKVEVSEIE